MAILTWPDVTTVLEMLPKSMENTQNPLTLALASPMNGDVNTYSLPGSRWGRTVTFRRQTYAQRRVVEGYLLQLEGQANRIRMWDFTNPTPGGTMNQTGVTVSALAAQFAESIILTGCGNTLTMKSGDWFEVTTSAGQQLLRCTADATSNSSGVMTVNFKYRLRGSVAATSSVILQKPMCMYIQMDPKLVIPYDPQGTAPEFAVSFIEAFR